MTLKPLQMGKLKLGKLSNLLKVRKLGTGGNQVLNTKRVGNGPGL